LKTKSLFRGGDSLNSSLLSSSSKQSGGSRFSTTAEDEELVANFSVFKLDQRTGVFTAATSAAETTLLDSGASRTMSSSRDDFRSISKEKVYLTTANKKSTTFGRLGVLKQNSLGLCSAVYLPALPIKRLVSVSSCIHAGWQVFLRKNDSFLQRGGESVSVTWDRNSQLFTIPFEILDMETVSDDWHDVAGSLRNGSNTPMGKFRETLISALVFRPVVLPGPGLLGFGFRFLVSTYLFVFSK
jgi:hypothetical protein